jgi:hypothetical protein
LHKPTDPAPTADSGYVAAANAGTGAGAGAEVDPVADGCSPVTVTSVWVSTVVSTQYIVSPVDAKLFSYMI